MSKKTKGNVVDTSKSTEDDALRDFLKHNSNPNVQPKTVNERSQEDVLATVILSRRQTNNEVMLTALKPELVNNEKQKRTFKEDLMEYIKKILIAQVAVLGLVVLICFLAISFKFPFMREIEPGTIEMMFEFLKYCITAIIAEFIAMLFFIVMFVFDKSIVDLIKQLFKNED